MQSVTAQCLTMDLKLIIATFGIFDLSVIPYLEFKIKLVW